MTGEMTDEMTLIKMTLKKWLWLNDWLDAFDEMTLIKWIWWNIF